MKDTELFDLCRQVYEATGWGLPYDGKNDLFVYRQDGTSSHKITSSMNWGEKIVCPLYTSDYLLGRLPSEQYETLQLIKAKNYWRAGVGQMGSETSDTPLKALLALTLKLHEEGLL